MIAGSASAVGVRRRAALRRHALALAVVFVALLLALSLAPHLADEVWQDEAATLMLYASRGAAHPFTDYSLPNNHMLFSSLLSLWWERGDGIVWLRLLPATIGLTSLAALLLCGRAVFGIEAAVLGFALFCGSAVTQAFVLGLRGYALSWPVLLLLLPAGLRYMREGRAGAGAVFAAAAFAAVAILPTNILASVVVVGWALAVCRAEPAGVRAGLGGRAVLALALCPLGLALYLPHWPAIVAHAGRGWSDWSVRAIAGHWLLATLGEYVLLAPLVLVAAVVARSQPTAGPCYRSRDVRRAAALLVVLALATPLALWAAPAAVFPRTLVPLLPLWLLAIGGLLAPAVIVLARRIGGDRASWLAAAVVVIFAIGHLTPPCAGIGEETPARADLCFQFHRQDYVPTALAHHLEQVFGAARPPIMLDGEAAWALSFIYWNRGLEPGNLVDFRYWRHLPGARRTPEFAISYSLDRIDAMLGALGFGTPRGVRVLIDSGFFKLYQLRWQ